MVVLVTGASGFLGRYVVQELLNHNHVVRCLIHTPGMERVFRDQPVDVYYGDVTDFMAMKTACHDVEFVISLVSVIHRTKTNDFTSVNIDGVANLMEAVRASDSVKHIVHISALGAIANPRYKYLHSKWKGEQEINKSGVPATILRPSIILGEGDEFSNILGAAIKISPIIPVIGHGRNRFQPIMVDDMAKCVVAALGRGEIAGRTIELGGPEQLSYNEIVDLICTTMGKRRLKVHMPFWVVWISVVFLELFFNRLPVNSDLIRILITRNVTDLGTAEDTLGISPGFVAQKLDYLRFVGRAMAFRKILGLKTDRIPPAEV
ncbi:MAG: NAD-dependent epimerase/dehydratase family protein [Chloroflexota bacterium]|nr:NAD-dependent epimerase/dehydratase family protein [Chloroflexota bacterium]